MKIIFIWMAFKISSSFALKILWKFILQTLLLQIIKNTNNIKFGIETVQLHDEINF